MPANFIFNKVIEMCVLSQSDGEKRSMPDQPRHKKATVKSKKRG